MYIFTELFSVFFCFCLPCKIKCALLVVVLCDKATYLVHCENLCSFVAYRPTVHNREAATTENMVELCETIW